jgi:molecular chaperone GrpE
MTDQAEVEKEIKEEIDEIKAETAEIKELKEVQQQEDYKAKYFYLAAEMDNMRKRNDRERENLLKYGNEKVLSGLVEVVDNLERSLAAIEGDQDEKIKTIAVGINMVRTQFLETLKSNGLEAIESIGKDFDPNLHEALGQQAAPEKRDQEIILEYQKGYVLNGRLLRAAKVVIAKND